MKGKFTLVLLTAIAVGCSAPDRDTNTYTGQDNANSDELITQVASAPATEGLHEIQTTTSTASQVAQTAAASQETASSGGSGTTGSSSAPATTEEEKKKKMSNTTKGILIGAGAGIITGAAVSKDDRAKGAVIGGVIGAAAGGATGAVIDHRKKKK